MIPYKNRQREAPTFANINLLGRCNVDCFFCLGKDIEAELEGKNQLSTPFGMWKNFDEFLEICKAEGIKNLYITGQNTDALMYRYLIGLINYLQGLGFNVGIRTNGYLFHISPTSIDIANFCKRSVGISIHSLNPTTNYQIMGKSSIPDWKKIIPQIDNPRVSIVLNRYNEYEFFELLQFLKQFDNIRYVQARRVSTDTRYDQLKPDMDAYERLYNYVRNIYPLVGKFYDAEIYRIEGVEVTFWPTVQTSVNSFNYFTDGTISKEYFVVEGYLKNREIE